jgi:hypothetical protein
VTALAVIPPEATKLALLTVPVVTTGPEKFAAGAEMGVGKLVLYTLYVRKADDGLGALAGGTTGAKTSLRVILTTPRSPVGTRIAVCAKRITGLLLTVTVCDVTVKFVSLTVSSSPDQTKR